MALSSWLDFHSFNRFLEDTCVLTTLAYLLSRGALLPKIFLEKRQRRDQLALALVFGLLGASELIFPGDRYPYVPFTLAAAFAGYAGGLALGLLSCITMAFCALLVMTIEGHSMVTYLLYVSTVLTSSLIGTALAAFRLHWVSRKVRPSHVGWNLLLGAFLAGFLAESCDDGLRVFVHSFVYTVPLSDGGSIQSLLANGLGCLILSLVLWDAHLRQEANLRNMQVERELAHLRLSQLTELQERLRPHFLFNALAGIAGLCVINPRHAEQAVTNLAALLRQFLRAPSAVNVSLREELTLVHSYLAIEQMRQEVPMQYHESWPEGTLSVSVPRFCLQVLVENAIQHGIVPAGRPGHLWLQARLRHRSVILIVCDNGVGLIQRDQNLETELAETERIHGLRLLRTRLYLAYGTAARLRLFSRRGQGTLCVLRLPLQTAVIGNKKEER